MENKINIVLVEYINRNLGDSAIAECTKYIVDTAAKQSFIGSYIISEYNMYQRDMSFISKADLIIFAGGGLFKYKRELFYSYIPQIIETAQEKDIPVYFNCVGVEGFDNTDERCKRLQKAVNMPCVKGISIRDDYDLFINHYLKSQKEWLSKVMDPVAFSSKIYCFKRNKQSNCIGLGIARGELFFDYGHKDITKEYIKKFWIDIIHILEYNGYEWQMFTNGLYDDFLFAEEILYDLDMIGYRDKYLATRPVEVQDLLRQIVHYKGIIAPRLHANILAYSQGVPSIGLVWNDKMIRWGERIGYTNRFIKADQLNPEIVFVNLMNAIKEGCNSYKEEDYTKIVKPLSEFLSKYGLKRSVNTNSTDFTNRLVAAAMGGFKFQYSGMNSSDTFLDKYQRGFRWFEVDLKLTSDNRIVCINGWNQKSLNKLGYYDSPKSLSMAEFKNLKGYYSGRFSTMDSYSLVQIMTTYSDTNYIFDVREQNIDCFKELIFHLKSDVLSKTNNEIIIRITDDWQIPIIKELNLRCKIMFEYPSDSEIADKHLSRNDINLCISNPDIDYFSLRMNCFDMDTLMKLKQYNKRIACFNTNEVGKIIQLISADVYWIGTDFLEVDTLNNMGLDVSNDTTVQTK